MCEAGFDGLATCSTRSDFQIYERPPCFREKAFFRLSHVLSHREEQIALPPINRKCDSFDSYITPKSSLIIVAAASLRDECACLSTLETTATVSSAPSD